MRIFRCLAAIASLAAANAATFSVVEPSPHQVTVDKTGSGTITLTLQNTSGAAQVATALGTSEFEHVLKAGSSYHVSGTAAIVPAAVPALAAGASVAIKVSISGLAEAGQSSFALLADGAVIDRVMVVRVPAAINVQLEGQNPEVVFAPGKQPALKIINNDATAYHFSWQLMSPSAKQPKQLPEFDLPASGSYRLDLSAYAPGYSVSDLLLAGTLKDDVRDGNIVLHPILAPAAAKIAPQSDKWLPLKIRHRYWDDIPQQLIAALVTFILLWVGAIFSLWMHYFIPNTTAMLRIRRQIEGMQERLNGIGDDLAPRWALLIGTRIAMTRADLDSMPKTYPAYVNVLTDVGAKAAMYNAWVDIAYEISMAMGDLRRLQQTGAPPTAIALIGRNIGEALGPVESGFSKPEELQTMQAAKVKVQQYVTALTAGLALPEIDVAIKDREQRVLGAMADLKADFPDFADLLEAVRIAAPKTLLPDQYLDRDTFSTQAEFLQQYRDLARRTGIVKFPPAAPTGEPLTAMDRIAGRDAELRKYVRPEAYKSLSIARIFIAEMRQDFYPGALMKEVGKSDAIEVHSDPIRPLLGEPVHLSVRFRRQQLNEIAAVQEWTVEWKFDGVLHSESGWDVYYAFCAAGTHKVEVQFLDLSGNYIVGSGTAPAKFSLASLNVDSARGLPAAATTWTARCRAWFARSWNWLSPEAWVETIRLAFALAVVMAGLFSTARDKVESLGLVQAAAAVVALGFTINTAKEIVVGKPEAK